MHGMHGGQAKAAPRAARTHVHVGCSVVAHEYDRILVPKNSTKAKKLMTAAVALLSAIDMPTPRRGTA